MKFNVKKTLNQTEETMWSKGERGIRVFSIDDEIEKYTNIIQVNNRIVNCSCKEVFEFMDKKQQSIYDEIMEKMYDERMSDIMEAKWARHVLYFIKHTRNNEVVRLMWDFIDGSNKSHKIKKIDKIMVDIELPIL